MEPHRPGPLKQQNKRHNAGKHRTKGQLKKVQGGRWVTRVGVFGNSFLSLVSINQLESEVDR